VGSRLTKRGRKKDWEKYSKRESAGQNTEGMKKYWKRWKKNDL